MLLYYIRPLLLDCPNKEMRTGFYNILGTTIHSYYNHKLHIKVSYYWIVTLQYCLLSILCMEGGGQGESQGKGERQEGGRGGRRKG